MQLERLKMCQTFVKIIFPIFLFCHSSLAESLMFEKISIKGLESTKPIVVMTELGFKAGEKVSEKAFKQGIDEIRNTDLFSEVTYTINYKNKEKTLVIHVVERWTTIPIFKIASGGGISQITLGVFDPNVFGKYIELGAQYEKLGDANSGVAWFKNPRLNNTKYGLDFQLWKTARTRTKYFQEQEKPVVQTGFLHKREKVFLGVNKEFTPSRILRVFYEYDNDTFSDDFISDEVNEALETSGGLPESTEFHFLGIGLDLGVININSYRFDGSLLSLIARYGVSPRDQDLNFWETSANYQYFKTIFNKSTFAQRLMIGATNTQSIQYWQYLGGLDRIRGFSDNRFAGSVFWLSNSEFRHPVFERDWLVLQGATFVDIASRGERFRELGTLDGASAGAGLRIFLPKVYRFTLRFDYAVPIIKQDEINFSFGVQQFF